MPTLSLMASAMDALACAYDRTLPLETCGFLLGLVTREHSVVTEVAIARDSPGYQDAFEIPEHELRRVGAYAKERGLQIVALFHSHPSGNDSLSLADLAALRYSAWPWVIVTRPNRVSAVAVAGYAPGEATRIGVQIIA